MKNKTLISRRLIVIIGLLLLLFNIFVPVALVEAQERTILEELEKTDEINKIGNEKDYIIDNNNKTISESIEENEQTKKLPQTATRNYIILFIGIILLVFSGLILIKTGKTN